MSDSLIDRIRDLEFFIAQKDAELSSLRSRIDSVTSNWSLMRDAWDDKCAEANGLRGDNDRLLEVGKIAVAETKLAREETEILRKQTVQQTELINQLRAKVAELEQQLSGSFSGEVQP